MRNVECGVRNQSRVKLKARVMNKVEGIVTISFCLFLIISCATVRKDCPLVGKWQSNEKATLEQMQKYGNLTEEKKNTFLNIFGKLTLEYTCSKVTSYSKDDLVVKAMKYEIVRREGDLLEIRYHAPELLGGTNTKQITLVGDCYYLPLERFTFSEVFCRVK